MSWLRIRLGHRCQNGWMQKNYDGVTKNVPCWHCRKREYFRLYPREGLL